MRPLRFLSLAAATALGLAAPAAAQPAAEAWADAYRLVLVRDWSAADSALGAFSRRFPDDANAPRAAFWHCYVAEQRDRLDEAAACYRNEASWNADARWKGEARARLVSVNARLRDRGTSGATQTRVVVEERDGYRYRYVVQDRSGDSPDTVQVDWMSVEADAEATRARAEAARARAEAQRARAEVQRSAAAFQRDVASAQRALAAARTTAERAAAQAQLDAAAAAMEATNAAAEAAYAVSVAGSFPVPPLPPVPPMPPACTVSRNGAVACTGAFIERTCENGTCTITAGGARADTLSPDERVAVLAVEALGRPGNAAAVPDLQGLAVSARSPHVRAAAVSALARVGTPAAAAAVVAAARAALARDASPEAEKDFGALVSALGRVASRTADAPGVAEVLGAFARRPGLRAGAVQALARLQGGEATLVLRALSEDAGVDAEVRIAALGYLVQRSPEDGPRAAARLEALARGTDLDVAREAVQGLVRLQGQPALRLVASRALLRVADDARADASVRGYATSRLGQHDVDGETIPLLVRLARDPAREVAESAVRTLGQLDAPEARAALLGLARGQ